jgi:hypothetical protein
MRHALRLVLLSIYTQISRETVAQVRRLVVCGILPHNTHTIYMILHETRNLILCGLRSGVNQQITGLGIRIVTVLEKNKFLAPIP